MLAGAVALALTAIPTFAQNTFYAPGDLVLFFQKPGNTNTVYVNLGNAATTFRSSATGANVATIPNIINVNTVLTSAFGGAWATDPDIYAGLAGVFDATPASTTLTNGDPARTLYISSARTAVGTVGTPESSAWDLTLAGNTAMTGASNGIVTQNTVFEVSYNAVSAASPTAVSQIDNQNPFGSPGIQGNAMQGNLEGGIQQPGSAAIFGNFAAVGDVEFALDLYRVQARKDLVGQVGFNEPIRVGTFEGIVTVATDGKVSFLSQGAASSPYDTWVSTFPFITAPADKLPTADSDHDGLTNLMEFVLNGNPGTSDPSIAPTLNASGSNFVYSFTRRDDSEAGSTLQFQYGSDLTGWTSATIGAGSSVVGNATINITQNASTDAITVSVPKTVAPGGTLFGRLKIIQ